MATTTNYSWTTPDDTSLVKDGAAAIRSLGTSIDTTTKALNPSTTLGDIEYRSSTANTNTRLAIGTTGQVLTVSGGVPSWTSPAGGGKVLQVVYGTYSTDTTSSSSTYADTGLTATITPTSATSKVMVLLTHNGCLKFTSDTYLGLKLFRGATDIATFGGQAGATGSSAFNAVGSVSLGLLDTPATTSATTYKTQLNSGNNTASARVGHGAPLSTILLIEIGA
jgi:hypothetical protein